MPAKNPRVNVVLELPLFEAVSRLAKKEGVSLSLKVRDLVREAVELWEDECLAAVATRREKSFVRSKALPHGQVWRHLKHQEAA
jgi:hypothetical protein